MLKEIEQVLETNSIPVTYLFMNEEKEVKAMPHPPTQIQYHYKPATRLSQDRHKVVGAAEYKIFIRNRKFACGTENMRAEQKLGLRHLV